MVTARSMRDSPLRILTNAPTGGSACACAGERRRLRGRFGWGVLGGGQCDAHDGGVAGGGFDAEGAADHFDALAHARRPRRWTFLVLDLSSTLKPWPSSVMAM